MEVPKRYGNVLQYVMENRPKIVILEVSENDTAVSENEQSKEGECGNNSGGRIVFLRAKCCFWGGGVISANFPLPEPLVQKNREISDFYGRSF